MKGESSLAEIARTVRREALDLAMEHQVSHIAPSLSTVEILVALFERVMKEEDRFLLSKGHGCLGLYALLRERGHSPKISCHPDIDPARGIHCTSGSLGHGLPIGAGMALARKLRKVKGNIFVLMSDGECQEGTTWESAMIAAHHGLDNLAIIIDRNGLQALGEVGDILSLGDLRGKLEAFGWHALEADGHDFEQIIAAVGGEPKGKPRALIAHTVKGKGVSFMENRPEWHSRLPNPEQLKAAREELQ